MADEMKGIEKLKKLADDTVRSIADQIEREHAEELAAAKRDLTDDAREVVERLRELDGGDAPC